MGGSGGFYEDEPVRVPCFGVQDDYRSILDRPKKEAAAADSPESIILTRKQMWLWLLLLAVIIVLMYVWPRSVPSSASECGACAKRKNVEPVE